MVSVELALAIPALLLILVLCLAGVGLGADHIRAADAARAAARAAARGDDPSQAAAIARQVAPPGSQVSVAISGERVVVDVQAPARDWLPGVAGAKARAVATLEPAGRGP